MLNTNNWAQGLWEKSINREGWENKKKRKIRRKTAESTTADKIDDTEDADGGMISAFDVLCDFITDDYR